MLSKMPSYEDVLLDAGFKYMEAFIEGQEGISEPRHDDASHYNPESGYSVREGVKYTGTHDAAIGNPKRADIYILKPASEIYGRTPSKRFLDTIFNLAKAKKKKRGESLTFFEPRLLVRVRDGKVMGQYGSYKLENQPEVLYKPLTEEQERLLDEHLMEVFAFREEQRLNGRLMTVFGFQEFILQTWHPFREDQRPSASSPCQ